MAKTHGLAGQFGKREATRRSRRLIGSMFFASTFVVLGIGFVTGYLWRQINPLIAAWTMLALAAATFVFGRRMGPYLDRIALERIKYMRGGQGEALIAYLLQRDLSDAWHVFNGVKLEADSDVDHVVVGPGGVFCLSTKSHRGLFAGTADGLLYNNRPSDFAQQALRQTMTLKDRLSVAMGRDVPWIQPVLAVPFGYIEADACGGKVWLVHQENVVSRLAPEDVPRRLSREKVERLVKTMEIIQANAALVYRRPDVPKNEAGQALRAAGSADREG